LKAQHPLNLSDLYFALDFLNSIMLEAFSALREPPV
jgi:hypothetical protein